MAKKNRRRNKPAAAEPKAAVSAGPGETRTAEVATIGWMLTFLVAAITELAAAAGGGLAYASSAGGDSPLVRAFIPLMLLSAAVAGGVCLALTPVVYRLRQLKPPPSITVLAVVTALASIAGACAWPLLGAGS